MKFIKPFLKFFESVGDIAISDREVYTKQMTHTLIDKLFFLDEVSDIDCIVDFGCADGFILSEIEKIRPNIKLIGYDLDKSMLELAKTKSNAYVTDNWQDVLSEIKDYKNVALNLSSVIHEVYSYSNSRKINDFWSNKVFGGYFKYITIRDTIPSIVTSKEDWVNFEEDVKKVNRLADRKQLASFEKIWGIIDNNYRTFLHFLLKYKYVDNWQREVRENYLPISLEWLKTKIPSNYKITYEKDFILDYLQQSVKKDFDIEIKHSTHTKMIIKKQS